MTSSRVSARSHVVIAGGGVAGLETALALRALAPTLADVELIAPEYHFWYRPLSVAEPFAAGRVLRLELAELASGIGAAFTPGMLVGVDAVAREALLADGARIAYDALVLALGALPRPALPGAFTFRGPADAEGFRALLDDVALTRGRVVFAVPPGTVWPLPLYELALMTANEARTLGTGLSVALVTFESAPLEIFGERGSEAISSLLAERGVEVYTGRYAVAFAEGRLAAVPGDGLEADRVVSLPRLEGPELAGVPRTAGGFVRTDAHGNVPGLDEVYAAGDLTAFPVKQGGIAAQQADVVAEAIAAKLGAPVRPRPFAPVLRGLLLTGGRPAYLRTELRGGHGETSTAAEEPLWWPPGKIVGRYLAPFLAEIAGVEEPAAPEGSGVLPVELELFADTT